MDNHVLENPAGIEIFVEIYPAFEQRRKFSAREVSPYRMRLGHTLPPCCLPIGFVRIFRWIALDRIQPVGLFDLDKIFL